MKLRKIKLINWHFFVNQTIDIDGNALLFGENGAGKSTIIDAINFVISGGTCRFNKAANEKSDRTPETYMKARIGKSQKEFARPEANIISHIALEFIDERNKSVLVIGAVLQLVNNNLLPYNFYSFREHSLSDELFFDAKGNVLGYDEFCRSYERKFGGDKVDSLNTRNTSARTRAKNVQSRLEVPNDGSYLELLDRAISSSNEDDIETFARKFLFKEDPIDSQVLQETAKDYGKIKRQLDIELAKKNALEPAILEAPNYYKAIDLRDIFCLLQEKAEMEKLGKANQELTRQNDKTTENRKAFEDKKPILEAALDAAKEELKKLRDDSSRNGVVSAYNDAKTKIETAKNALKGINLAIADWGQKIEEEKDLGKLLKISTAFQPDFMRRDFDSYQNDIYRYKDSLESEASRLRGEESELENKIRGLSERLTVLETEIRDLKLKHNTNSELKVLKSMIERKAIGSGFQANDLYMDAVCEYVEVIDESWRGALEGLLGVYRFDLFVPGAIYKTAFSVFEEAKDLSPFFGNGVVKESLLGNTNVSEGSIITKLKVYQNDLGLRYLSALFGDVLCVEDAQEKPNGRWITKDGLYFDGKSIRRLDPKEMAKPFIGPRSIEIRLKNAEGARESIIKDKNQLSSRKNEISNLLRAIDKSYSRRNDLVKSRNYFMDLDANEHVLKRNEELVKQYEQDGELLAYTSAYNAAQGNLETAQKNLKENERSIESCIETLSDNANAIKANGEKILEHRQRFNQVLSAASPFVDAADLNEYSQGKTGAALFDFVRKSLDEANASVERHRRSIEQTLKAFEKIYATGEEPAIQKLPCYEKIYGNIVNIDIKRLAPEAEKQSRIMERLFYDKFAQALMDKISQTHSRQEALNRVLRGRKFGTENEEYRFVVTKRKDSAKDNYGELYAILDEKRKEVLRSESFYENMEEDERKAFNKVFQILIGGESGEKNEDLIREFCDYRNYMNYDIDIVTTDSQGNESHGSYKENYLSKSGGETQTPFYVMVGAAIYVCVNADLVSYRSTASPCSLVIIDEAFNNMDEGRIREMLSYYDDLGLQLIASVPTRNAYLLMDKMDTVISLAKEDNDVEIFETYHKRSAK